jgi:hypothetical protein
VRFELTYSPYSTVLLKIVRSDFNKINDLQMSVLFSVLKTDGCTRTVRTVLHPIGGVRSTVRTSGGAFGKFIGVKISATETPDMEKFINAAS